MTDTSVFVGCFHTEHTGMDDLLSIWLRAVYPEEAEWIDENVRGHWWLEDRDQSEPIYVAAQHLYYRTYKVFIVFDEVVDAVHYKLRWT